MADPVEVMARVIVGLVDKSDDPFDWNEYSASERLAAANSARKALSALDAAGFAVVPKEPTDAMRSAAMDILLHTGDIYIRDEETIVVETYTSKAIYRAMLSAAQVKP